jgi:hypothetical protein
MHDHTSEFHKYILTGSKLTGGGGGEDRQRRTNRQTAWRSHNLTFPFKESKLIIIATM